MTTIATDYDAASAAFETAFAKGGTTAFYRIAGQPVRVRVAGPMLAEEIDLPLRHLRMPPCDSPALTADMWNAEECGVPAVMGDRGRLDSPYGNFFMSDDRRYLGMQRATGAYWQDCAAGRIVGCAEGLARRSLDERARPFHRLLAAWMWDLGVQFVHAGLVAREDAVSGGMKGVLFVGKSGSGKTTSSIACFRGGLTYLGDDFIGLEQTADGFAGHGLFGSCLVNVEHLKRFPDLNAVSLAPRNDYEDKAVVYMAPIDDMRLAASVPIAAIVMPRIVDRPDTIYRRATKGQALLTMAPSSVMSLPIMVHGAMDRLAGLVDAVPAYWLELGRDVNDIPHAVNALFDELDANAESAGK
ncbi:hypothetical protein [Emcibacter sp. SYSU 3D8]|uniref:hypothetical protein n=1 Tax=Emcibacter sp. SYSU 3D8 TaxID=3133969 RepID=UPI0031FF3276